MPFAQIGKSQTLIGAASTDEFHSSFVYSWGKNLSLRALEEHDGLGGVVHSVNALIQDTNEAIIVQLGKMSPCALEEYDGLGGVVHSVHTLIRDTSEAMFVQLGKKALRALEEHGELGGVVHSV